MISGGYVLGGGAICMELLTKQVRSLDADGESYTLLHKSYTSGFTEDWRLVLLALRSLMQCYFSSMNHKDDDLTMLSEHFTIICDDLVIAEKFTYTDS